MESQEKRKELIENLLGEEMIKFGCLNKENPRWRTEMLETVYPLLFKGLEAVAERAEKVYLDPHTPPKTIERFNPRLFLAQFLMRNNPKFQNQSGNVTKDQREIKKAGQELSQMETKKRQFRARVNDLKGILVGRLKEWYQSESGVPALYIDQLFPKLDQLFSFDGALTQNYVRNRFFCGFVLC